MPSKDCVKHKRDKHETKKDRICRGCWRAVARKALVVTYDKKQGLCGRCYMVRTFVWETRKNHLASYWTRDWPRNWLRDIGPRHAAPDRPR